MFNKTLVLGLALVVALMLGMTACAEKEPIVGSWQSVDSGVTMEVNGDGTYTGGTWEKCEWMPVVEAEGEEWSVYIVIPSNRTVVGEGELGNTYKYDDKYGDYFFLVSDDEIALTIGAGNVETVAETGKISSNSKSNGYTRA